MSASLVASTAARRIEQYGTQMVGILDRLSQDEIWAPGPGGANAIGTLAHHLAGNLRHYLGAGVSGDGYVRDRPAEFADRDIPKDRLIANLNAAVAVAQKALDTVDEARLTAPHTTPCGQDSPTLADHIAGIATHIAYHAGQADYAVRRKSSGGQ